MQTKIELTQFRDRLYRSLPGRGDTVMDLLDALSGNHHAQSVVELSLSPAFRRGHSSFHRAIDRFFAGPGGLREWAERCALEKQLRRATQSVLDRPKQRDHWLFALDGTPYSRPHAKTLEDRTWVHQSESTSGRMPVTIGHQYSFVVGLPERAEPDDPAWVVPLSSRRVPSSKTPNQVGQEQIRAILDDPQLPWYEQCVVVLGDSAYGSLPFLGPMGDFENLVLLTRIRGNRVFHHMPADASTRQWYGTRFCLSDPTTWAEPAESIRYCLVTRGGRQLELRVDRWSSLLMRGTHRWKMHRRPFDLLRVARFDTDGKPVAGKPMWLMIMGQRRTEIPTVQAATEYGQRFDQEHFHRFCKQNLLLDAYQTPETEHEENWVMLVSLAYIQLMAARRLVKALPHPWARKVSPKSATVLTPTLVQRDFARLIRQLGTPARPPKPRNLGVGRREGQSPGRRPRRKVVRKAEKQPRRARAPATSPV